MQFRWWEMGMNTVSKWTFFTNVQIIFQNEASIDLDRQTKNDLHTGCMIIFAIMTQSVSH